MADRPNIVFLHAHNTGRFVEPYGHAVPTPRLRRLAEEGVLFKNAFAPNPTCSPSRASFLTGLYPHSCGMLGLAHRGFAMDDKGRHAVHHFRAHGYRTALAGVEHTSPDPHGVGYDRVLSAYDTNYPGTLDDPPIAPAAAAFLREPPEEPFFLSVGLNETHRPFHEADPGAHPAEDERFTDPPAPLPDTPETRRDTAHFKASARVMDEAFGEVLDALEAAGAADRTLVCCFSDHGLQFPRHMANLTDGGIGVFCVLRGPGGFAGGRVVEAPVSLVDLLPTACEVAGIPAPDGAEGVSLAPLARGERERVRDEVFAELNYHAAYEPQRCVRTERYKYIRRFDERDRLVLPNVDESPSKDALLARGWEREPRPFEMLFDLAFDPDETCNRIDEPALQPVRDDLRGRLERWVRDTADPLVTHGEIPAPPGALANDPDGRSPKETPRPVA